MTSARNDETGDRNDEALMTNDEGNGRTRVSESDKLRGQRNSGSGIPSTFGIRNSSFAPDVIATKEALAKPLGALQCHDRIAIDTEADSLHCYREKLCLLQISTPHADFVVDPLAGLDLRPLSTALAAKELIVHGADYDLRLLRRGFDFVASRIFDTVIAARLLGIREFSLAALLKNFFAVELVKGSQKANWAQRPLPARLIEYAANDTHYLLPLAKELEAGLREQNRLEWFRQSCERAIEQAAVDRERDSDEVWRIAGAGALSPRTAAILREIWRWREKEAERADRPPFHILQNEHLLRSAEEFAAGGVPDYRHFSPRRRDAFRRAGQAGLELPEEELPVMRRRSGRRPTAAVVRRADELKRRRDRAAGTLKLEPSIVAPKTVLEAIALDEACAGDMLVPWQRELLEV
jgi:ribonuclease D